MMNYDNLLHDFAQRTQKNLLFIECHINDPDYEVYEVTQLINSMLGLLVFPQQYYIRHIPQVSLAELMQMGWPEVRVTSDIKASKFYRPCTNLRELVRYLRNSISHFNIQFLSDANGKITGIRVWNTDTWLKDKPKTWEADLDLETLRILTFRFIELMEEQVIEKSSTSYRRFRP
jgi:hypothetical protein